MHQYLDLVMDVMVNGVMSDNRTGVRTTKVFGRQIRFDLRAGFPLVTTKKMFTRGLVEELLWFLRGETNEHILRGKKVNIWNEWATESGQLGPIYGAQWRSWPASDGTTIDQIQDAIDLIKNYPNSRRIIVSAWNPEFIPSDKISPQDNVMNGKMALAPCHCLFQFVTSPISLDERIDVARFRGIDFKDFIVGLVSEDLGKLDHASTNEEARRGMASKLAHNWYEVPRPSSHRMTEFLDQQGVPKHHLSCMLTQRSSDLMIGIPVNIASYALLTHIMAELTNTVPKDFIHSFGDLHIYENHFNQAAVQLQREPKPLPTLRIKEKLVWEELDQWQADWFVFENYRHDEPLRFSIAV